MTKVKSFFFLRKLNTPVYFARYATPAATLAENHEKFPDLSPADQCRALMQMLNLFTSNAASADLKFFNGIGKIGVLRTSKSLANAKDHSFKLIHQSITGVYEKEIDLLGDKF